MFLFMLLTMYNELLCYIIYTYTYIYIYIYIYAVGRHKCMSGHIICVECVHMCLNVGILYIIRCV